MAPFEKWIQQKSGEQNLQYSPENWDQFQAFARHQRRRKRRVIFLFLLLGLLLLGTAGYWMYLSTQDDSTPTEFVENRTEKDVPSEKELTSYQMEDTPAERRGHSSEPQNKHREFTTVSANEDETSQVTKSKERPGLEQQPASTSQKAPTKTNESPTNPGQREVRQTPNPTQKSLVSERTAETGSDPFAEADAQKNSKKELTASLSKQKHPFLSQLPLSPLSPLSYDLSRLLLSRDSGSNLDMIESTSVDCCPTQAGLRLTATGIVANSQFNSPGFFSGGQIALEYAHPIHPRWTVNSGLGMALMQGDFGIQKDHSIIENGFVKRVTGYQTLPTHAYALAATVSLEYHLSNWQLETGLSLHHLLGVRGKIENYGSSPPPTDAPQGTQWLTRDGFTRWSPGLLLATHYQLTPKWQVGLRAEWKPLGWLQDDHRGYYDHATESYTTHPNSVWGHSPDNLQFAVNIKYKLL